MTTTSTITTTAGTLIAGNATAGRNAGNVTVRGVNRDLTGGAIGASGSAAVVAGQAGGNAEHRGADGQRRNRCETRAASRPRP